jgi:hypothetical protein
VFWGEKKETYLWKRSEPLKFNFFIFFNFESTAKIALHLSRNGVISIIDKGVTPYATFAWVLSKTFLRTVHFPDLPFPSISLFARVAFFVLMLRASPCWW